jgi:succinate dehydrogenase flavin-adding protein (antitoxin of CptAB toxin-antitoxin module)
MNKIYTNEILFPYGIIMCQKGDKNDNLPDFYQILIKKDNEWVYIINNDNEAQPLIKEKCLELITKFKNKE